ncbi:MAG TPA: 2,5-diamino-6-(ribosylamino)-4(3H)-pyrimidinone 5'-phosphate reductase [Candidatus Thermoplasmatota archaeon]|nr:2,5-diamino-6-(ribosylamino)-4(3H)-pyrimidinone 5'-phosphate reductase [Candidatus Thermoplasmatota archaeon]
MKRPRVIVNCAMSADGKIALPNRRQLRISSDEDIARVYRLRNQCDAVLVGVGTILSDDPKLTVKEAYVKHPRQPLRVVLDSNGRTPSRAMVLNKTAKTLIIMAKGNKRSFKGSHIEVARCTTDRFGLLEVPCILELLVQRGIKTLLVEGGSTVIWSFMHSDVVDDLFVYVGSCIIGGKSTPTMAGGQGVAAEDEAIPLRLVGTRRLGEGILMHYQP